IEIERLLHTLPGKRRQVLFVNECTCLLLNGRSAARIEVMVQRAVVVPDAPRENGILLECETPGFPKKVDVDFATDLDTQRQVVRGHPGVEFLQNIQPLLPRGQWKLTRLRRNASDDLRLVAFRAAFQ